MSIALILSSRKTTRLNWLDQVAELACDGIEKMTDANWQEKNHMLLAHIL